MGDNWEQTGGEVIAGPRRMTPICRKECPYHAPEPIPFIRIFIEKTAVEEIMAVASATGGREIGGFLIGLPFCDSQGLYLIINGIVPALHTLSGAGHITFTADTWTDALEQQEKRFPKVKIVGWYHTHPSFGVFLSDHDLFIHKNFFDTEWLVAYVLDPEANETGFFGWRNGKVSPIDVHWIVERNRIVEDVVFSGDPDRGLDPVGREAQEFLIELKATQENLKRFDQRQRRLERLMTILVPLTAILFVIVLLLLFDRYPIAKEFHEIIGTYFNNPQTEHKMPNPESRRK